jgi:WxL Interacting Protein, peptidoglycan binding domain
MSCAGRRPGGVVRALLAAIALTGVGVLPFASPAGAADNGTWAVEPAGPGDQAGRDHFVYALNPGQSLIDTVAISNLSDAPITFDVYATDAYNTTPDAAFALLRKEDIPEDAGSWIRFEVNEYTVPPRTRAEIPFEITVPLNATPGDHAAGVVAENTEVEAQVQDDDINLGIERRVGSRVYVRVAGPITPALRIDNLQVKHRDPLVSGLSGQHHVLVEYDVTNAGNIRITSEARVEIESLFGVTLKEFDAHPVPELLPGNSVHIIEAWETVPPLGPITANVEVVAEEATARASEKVWLVPWFWIVVALGLIAFLLIRRRRRRRRRVESMATPPEEPKAELVDA